MKCPECRRKMSRLETTCAKCGHELTEQDVKKVKLKRRLALWIPLGIVIAFFVLILLIVLIPSPYVDEITINNPNSEVEYLDSLDLSICCTNDGLIASSYEVPITIDDEVIEVVEFKLPGFEYVTKEISIARSALPESGIYELGVSDSAATITLLDAARFNIAFPVEDLALAVGEPYEIAFEVENAGPSSGSFEYTITFNGQDIESGDMTIPAMSVNQENVTITSDTAGTYDLSINDTTLAVPFYESKPYENGHYLMKNTVKGYSYVEITNDTDQDMVAYITKADDQTTAVAARYIAAGDVHKVNSIVSGDYYLFIQTGELWLPEVTKFGKNNKVYRTEEFTFKNAMRGGYGSYEYQRMTLVDYEDTRFISPTDTCPAIP